jgi:hypothetical protein
MVFYSILKKVEDDGLNLKLVPNKFKNNKYIVLKAVKSNGLALFFASNRLKNNKKIVFAAIQNNIESLKYASDKIQNDKIFLINLYKNIVKDKYSLKYYNDFIFYFSRFMDYFEYNSIDDDFLNIHYDILHLIKNKEKIYEYLLNNKKYEIIYKNKNIQEYIKINNNILILSINYLDPNYNKLKLYYQETFKKYILIFI